MELLNRAIDTINRQDLDAHLALIDDDVVIVPRTAPLEGSYHGHDGYRRWWGDQFDVFPDFTIELGEVGALGDVTIAFVHVRGHGAGSDVPSDTTAWSVARWRRGKCVWWGNFDTRVEALEAVGLSEQGTHADS